MSSALTMKFKNRCDDPVPTKVTYALLVSSKKSWPFIAIPTVTVVLE